MPDGTTKQADATLGAEGQGTPQYTQEQLNKMLTDARTAVMADAGRARAEAEKAVRAANDALARLARFEQEKIDAELETHKDDPAQIKRIRAEQKARQLEADLAKEREVKTEYEQKIQTYETEKAELTKNVIAGDVAKRLNVDVEKLTSLAKFTDGSQQAIEAIAAEMPKITPASGGKPDSTQSHGGSGGLTKADVAKMSPTERTKRASEIAAISF